MASHPLESQHGPSALWDDVLWEPLLASLDRGQVVPIIGPELSVVEIDGNTQSVRTYVACRLAEQLGLDLAALPHAELSDVIGLAMRHKVRPMDVYPRIHAILRDAAIKPGPTLKRLAAIRSFGLYVSLSFDTLLEQALADERGTTTGPSGYNSYHPRRMPDCDLVSSVAGGPPLVYYLFGRCSVLPEYAVSDSDLLEYLFGMQSAAAPRNLLDVLKGKSLLFLGGAFPDWLIRIVLRLTRQKPLSSPRELDGAVEILADSLSYQDPKLVGFLSDFSVETRVFHAGADDFVDQLWTRWSERSGIVPPIAQPKAEDAFVFLSYAREDSDAAAAISRALRAAGVSCWMDTERMEGGQNFRSEIVGRIARCELFLPLISRNTEARLRDTYFRREWRHAEDRRQGTSDSVIFTVPIIVDDLDPGALREIPEHWKRDLNMCRAPCGVLDPRGLRHIQQLMSRGS